MTAPPCCGLTHDQLLIAIGLATGLATMLGGALALGLRRSADLLVGLSSGAVIGVALFDLLPEALEVGRRAHSSFDIVSATAAGFAVYLVFDRATLILAGRGGAGRGNLGAASLTLHSLMDGLGIGLAFQVSTTAGLIVAAAVLAHDMLDGINTVTVSLAGGARRSGAALWLAADAAAPIVEILLTRLISVPAPILSLLLAGFAGFFLYIGASELLPQSHDRRPRVSTIVATLSGLVLIYVVVRLAES